MKTTYTLRYRLSNNPESLKVLDFTSERAAIEKALDLHYGHIRTPYKCYDISINWDGFNAAKGTAQLHAWEEAFQEYLNTLPQ